MPEPIVCMDAVVLAGRANTGRLQEISAEKQEAMIRLAGRPQVEYVVEALAHAQWVRKIILVAPEELESLLGPRMKRVDVVGDLLGNLRQGLAAARTEWVLIVTSDLPLVQGHMVDTFLQDCFSYPGASVYMPVVSAATLENFHAGMQRTYGRVREGRFTGGNLFLIRRDIPESVWQRAEEFVAARKSVFRLASLLGLGFILRMLLWPPSIAQLEKRISRLFNLPVRAVMSSCAELAVDCDKPGDFHLLSQVLAARSPAGEGSLGRETEQ